MTPRLTWSDRKKSAHDNLKGVDWRRVVFISLFFGITGLIYTLYLVPTLGWRIPCPFETIFGITDAGEGLTSAIYQTLHGNFYQALRLNATLFIAPPLFVLSYILNILSFKQSSRVITITTLTLVTIYGVLRNFETFSYLQPTWLA